MDHPSDMMNLPQELLELILQRVSLMDNLMNCRATCRSWRKVADAVFTSKLPLMLSLSPSESEEPNLASLSAPWSNDHKSSITVLTEAWPRAVDCSTDIIRVQSVQGWLMFNKFHHLIDKDQTFCELCFFNPFSRASFKLPKLFLFSTSAMSDSRVRVVFNSAPPGSDEFVVVLLCASFYNRKDDDDQMRQNIAFFKFKQGSWIVSESIVEINEIFYDIAIDEYNKLYGLTHEHNTSVVFVLTLGGDDHKYHVVERLVMQNSIEDINFMATSSVLFGISSFRTQRLAMDTSTGELLLVLYYQFSCSSVHVHTEEFHVYKLEKSSLRWCEVFDIGDRFMLWDSTRVSFVSAKGLSVPEKFKRGNCVFFIQHDDIGFFFLGDRNNNYVAVSSSLPFSIDQNLWFSPAP
ncbi:hypothetical protein PIB30_015330 [Stylosanthes scabra]|uniref:F-box domain-containing protein n=1 Tax=Stylosanthes scabra TaxID=79078 RepID=A0ABU6Q6W1_9FABA|nr:hypothetical protein [Stylosanthes scabra]